MLLRKFTSFYIHEIPLTIIPPFNSHYEHQINPVFPQFSSLQAPVMGKFLKDASPGVVAAAAYVLSGMGPAAAEHVAALEAALGNESETWLGFRCLENREWRKMMEGKLLIQLGKNCDFMMISWG